MGGEYRGIKVYIRTDSEKDLRDKWAEIVANAQYTHGHGGYSGTFAEKHQLQVIPLRGNSPWHERDAEGHCAEKNDKWGPAFAYYLGNHQWYIGGWCSS